MEIVCWIILFLLSTWLLLSLFIVAYWFFDPAEWFWDKHRYISIAIGIGACFTFGLVVMMGIEGLLWFIPGNWVYETQEGGLQVVRHSIAALIGLIAACFLGFLFDKVVRMRRANLNLNTELVIIRKIARRKEDLDLLELGESELEQAIADFKLKLEELEELAMERRLTHTQEVERGVLIGLIEDLLKRMGNT